MAWFYGENLHGTSVPHRCDGYIICTTNWFIQTSLEFRKWGVYRDFILKDTIITYYYYLVYYYLYTIKDNLY